MTKEQALSILRPHGNLQEDLKKAWKKAAIENHPDKGGDLELMKLVNIAYDTLKFQTWTRFKRAQANKTTPLTEIYKKIIANLNIYEELKIEIIGSWLWVTGETEKYKKILRKNNLSYSENKKAWYFHEGTYTRRHKKDFSINEIRSKYGSNPISKNHNLQLSA